MLISLVRSTVEFVEAKIPETSTSDRESIKGALEYEALMWFLRTIHKNLPIAFSFLWAQGLKGPQASFGFVM